jgi:hypothetical protein
MVETETKAHLAPESQKKIRLIAPRSDPPLVGESWSTVSHKELDPNILKHRMILEEKRLEWDIQKEEREQKRIEIEFQLKQKVKLGLARQELRNAGVPETEIDQLFPL